MPNHREVPDWKFGDIVTNDNSNAAQTARMLFLRWVSRVDHNPSESVFESLVLDRGEFSDVEGSVIRAYCGWWMLLERDPSAGGLVLPSTIFMGHAHGSGYRPIDPAVTTSGSRGGKTAAMLEAAKLAMSGMTTEEIADLVAKRLGPK